MLCAFQHNAVVDFVNAVLKACDFKMPRDYTTISHDSSQLSNNNSSKNIDTESIATQTIDEMQPSNTKVCTWCGFGLIVFSQNIFIPMVLLV